MTSPLPHLDLAGTSRVLCIAAHPDDLEYGISCAVAEWTAAGLDVSYLLLTRGEAGISTQDPSITGPARSREQIDAGAAVGAEDVRFLDHPDGLLSASIELRRDITGVIRELRPDLIVTSTWELEVGWGLNHPDHRAAGIAVADAARDAANPWVFTELAEPWQPSRLLVAGHGRPTHRVVVSEESLERGIASLAAHRTYLEALPDHPSPAEVMHEVTGGHDQPAISFNVWDL